MKIALVSEAYPPMAGGVATSARRLSREFVKQGHQITVYTYDNIQPVTSEDFYYREEDSGVEIYRAGPFFLKNNTLKNLNAELTEKYCAALRRRVFDQILRLMKKNKPDIILSFYLLNSGWLAQMLANYLELPCIAGVRGNDIGRNIFHTERFGVIKWIIDEANAVICVNEHLKRRTLSAFRDIKSKIFVIPNGFDISAVNNFAKNKREWPEEYLTLAFIGSLREKKGIITLLRSLEKSEAENNKIRLLVIGPDIDGAERVIAGDLWEKLKGNDIIRVTGQIPREEVISRAGACDVICCPSLDDGMANGLLEGMAAGLCPLVTDIFADVVKDKETGLIVEAGDVEGLSDAMKFLQEHRTLAEQYGEAAKQAVINNHSPKDEALKYIDIMQKVIRNYGLEEHTAL